MRTLPQTPEQLLEELFTIFPAYRADNSIPTEDDAPTYHSILIELMTALKIPSACAGSKLFGTVNTSNTEHM